MSAFIVASVLLWIPAIVSSSNSSFNSKNCTKQCFNITDGSSFTYGCYRAGLQTECNLTSTAFDKGASKEPHCISPGKVPGFISFCKDVLENWVTPSNIQVDEISTTLKPHKNESIRELAPDETCYGSTVLVSVGIGSFVLGCSLTLIVLCFCRFFKPCSKPKIPDESPRAEHAVVGWEAGPRDRNLQGSTSSALLIQEASSETSPGPSTLTTAPRTSPNGIVPADRCRFKYPVAMTRENCVLPTPDPIYVAGSEHSSRDYQSIRCESENPYVLNSECGSDYSTAWRPFDRLNDHAEYDNNFNDYSTLNKGNHNARANPASEDSGKDYTSLLGDRVDLDLRENSSLSECEPKGATGFSTNFQVKDLNFPKRDIQGGRSLYDAGHPMTELPFTQHNPILNKENRTNGRIRNTLADLLPQGTVPETESVPHEYFILEPTQNKT